MKKTLAVLLTLALAILACACSAPVSSTSETAVQETAAPDLSPWTWIFPSSAAPSCTRRYTTS